MDSIFNSADPKHLRLLILSDIDVDSSSKVAEQFIPYDLRFDFILVCGPFCSDLGKAAETPEDLAAVLGEAGSTLASLENIVCRIAYVGAPGDPEGMVSGEYRNLTPNSVNLHNRVLKITSEVFIMGCSEGPGLLSSGLPYDFDRSPESDDEMEGVEVKKGSHAVEMIENLLLASRSYSDEGDENTLSGMGYADAAPRLDDTVDSAGLRGTPISTGSSPGTFNKFGIFVLNYRFAHTLNHVLFHMPEALKDAGINICIIPPSKDTGERVKLPAKLGDFHTVALGSTRLHGHYTVLEISKGQGDGIWAPTLVEFKTLDTNEYLNDGGAGGKGGR